MALDGKALINAVVSHAETLGMFARVNGHEPKNAPGLGVTLSFWLDRIRPITSSGLNSTSALVVVNARLQSPMLAEPQDDIDPELTEGVSLLFNAYHQDLTLGGRVRAIDVFGQQGFRLEGRAGYIEQDRRQFRIFTLTVPLLVNDVWTQSA
jgi:hypothetical protein